MVKQDLENSEKLAKRTTATKFQEPETAAVDVLVVKTAAVDILDAEKEAVEISTTSTTPPTSASKDILLPLQTDFPD